MRGRMMLGLALSLAIAAPAIAQTVTTYPNVADGQSGFGGTKVIDWTAFYASGTTFTTGIATPYLGGAPFTQNGATASGNLVLGNWIDGTGFDDAGGAGADLAINGKEDFTLSFATPVYGVGFAVASGLGNLATEYDHRGATFNFTTDIGGSGSFTLNDLGNGVSVWVSFLSPTAFSTLSIVEQGTNIQDQYFGDIYAQGGAVPEPATWGMMILGFGAVGGVLRRRRVALAAA